MIFYKDITIEGDSFYYQDFRTKSEGALETLQKIELILNHNLTSKNLAIKPDHLKKIARDIHTRFNQKANHLCFLRRYFGGVDEKQRALTEVLQRIENTSSFSDLPPEIIEKVFSELSLSDLLKQASTNILFKNVMQTLVIRKARNFGLDSTDFSEAKHSLYALSSALQSVKHLIPRECVVFESFFGIDFEKTFQNIQRLDAEEMTEFKNALNETWMSEVGKNGKSHYIRPLICLGVDLNMQDNQGSTALFCAVWRNRSTTCKALLEAGANPNISTNWGSLPIFASILHNNTRIYKALLEVGADLNIPMHHGKTIINELCQDLETNRLSWIELLLKTGADPNIPDNYGHTALWLAPTCIQKKLLVGGADPSGLPTRNGETALMCAGREWKFLILDFFVKTEEDLNQLWEAGHKTAYYYCRFWGIPH